MNGVHIFYIKSPSPQLVLNPLSLGPDSRSSPKNLARTVPWFQIMASSRGVEMPSLLPWARPCNSPQGLRLALHSLSVCPHQGGLTCGRCQFGPRTVSLCSFSPLAPQSQDQRAEQMKWHQSRGTCTARRSPSPLATWSRRVLSVPPCPPSPSSPPPMAQLPHSRLHLLDQR